MTVSKTVIKTDLQNNLGLKSGDIVAVHSSLKSLGRVEGGAATVITALITAINAPEQGTLLMPCFNHPAPEIDLRTAPCRLGAVSEAFRTFPGVKRSVNATHSVAAFGRNAAELVNSHFNRQPLGTDSPFHQLAKKDGYVLHIGCTMKSCSLIHVAESIHGIPYQHITYPGYGTTIKVTVDDSFSFDWDTIEYPGDSANFSVVQNELMRRGLLVTGKVGQADCLLAKGSDILQVSLDLLKLDPAALLCSNERCPVCPERRAVLQKSAT